LLQGSIFFQDPDNVIRTIDVDGGSGLLSQSFENLTAGGFPFLWVAKDVGGDFISPKWIQNGRNNSFSGTMNTFGTVPKSWVTLPFNASKTQDENDADGIDLLFNVSDYIKYCAWLQDNQSLVPEGCKYFADTTGRKVPLLFGGDLEIHRSATIHEGFLLFNNFNYLTREGNPFEIFNGTIINQIPTTEEVGVGVGDNITFYSEDFPGTLNSFSLIECIGAPSTCWGAVFEAPCHLGACASAGSNVDTTMEANTTTLNGENLNLTFWATEQNVDATDTWEVQVNNYTGSGWVAVLTETDMIGASDTFFEVTLPTSMNNSVELGLRVVLDVNHPTNEVVWMDEFEIRGTAVSSTNVNITCDQLILSNGDVNVLRYDCINQSTIISGNVTATITEDVVSGSVSTNSLTIPQGGNTITSFGDIAQYLNHGDIANLSFDDHYEIYYNKSTVISTFVNKSGDTMTGDLVVPSVEVQNVVNNTGNNIRINDSTQEFEMVVVDGRLIIRGVS